jgi:hypothetical protein
VFRVSAGSIRRGLGLRGRETKHMTQAKKLKKIIRQRARKTGERYAAARRQVLGARETPPPSPPARPRTSSRGALSDAAALKRTGHTLAHWFGVLDAFGARTKGHTASARHLFAAHGVPGWHAQGITVAYERAHGLRAANQACDGRFNVSVSRVVSAAVPEIARALGDPAERSAWLRGADPRLVRALESAFEGPKPRTVKVRDPRGATLRYPWDGTTVEFRLTAKPKGGSSVVVDHMNLATPDAVESSRASWKAALDGLKQHLSR